jgi:hypothetical protein
VPCTGPQAVAPKVVTRSDGREQSPDQTKVDQSNKQRWCRFRLATCALMVRDYLSAASGAEHWFLRRRPPREHPQWK